MVEPIKSFRNYLALSVVLLVASCSSGYHLVKTNRAEYNVNKELTVDSSIIKTYLPYKAQLDAEMNKVIGHSAAQMSKKAAILYLKACLAISFLMQFWNRHLNTTRILILHCHQQKEVYV
ncbi:hypothetical protein [Pedobacter steynii]